MRPDVWAQGVSMSRVSLALFSRASAENALSWTIFLRFSIIDGPMFLEIVGKAVLEWFRNVSCCLAVDIV